jgi:hypothetical protein
MRLALVLAPLLLLTGCTASTPVVGAERLTERLTAIESAVQSWQSAATLAEAQRYAEQARNLVVGPDGPNYGDADGDGQIAGATETALLPDLAADVSGACIERDILGGSWDDPDARWATLQTAIDAWAPANNTFPSLPSHPQRIVGWATLTLETSSLETAHEYAGHAQLHVDVSQAAVESC